MEEYVNDPKDCNAYLPAVGDALYVIGGKWKLSVIVAVRNGHKRFNEIQRAIQGISARVLSNELKELEMNGLVHRSVDPENPLLVEYQITAYAESLKEVLSALFEWGTLHKDKIRMERSAASRLNQRSSA